MFDHIVLTRFNTDVAYAPNTARLGSEWLRARLEPFEAICLPSMKAQKGAGVRWAVLVDSASPTWFKERMETHAPLLDVIYVTGVVRTEDLAPLLRSNGLASQPWVITTRLDSDDALAVDHLLTVQEVFAQQTRTFVEFPVGYQLVEGSLYATMWRSNPFLSLIERVREDGSFDTAICRPHGEVLRAEDTISLWRRPMWLQSIHATNNESAMKVGVPRLTDKPSPRFDMNWSTPPTKWSRMTKASRTVSRRLRRLIPS